MTRRSLRHDVALAVGVAIVSTQSAFDDGALKRPAWAVVGADRRDQPVALAGHAKPGVILMDIRMPNMDGVEATRRIVAAGNAARILILTTYDVDEYVFEALRAGASGFLLKDIRPVELEAIRVIARGEALLAPTVTRRLLDRFAHALPRSEATAAPRAGDAHG